MSIMNINKLAFRNFKTLENVSFEPGRVNVFIGANGSGKTTVLETIGLLCAAMTDRIDNSSMQRKGIRLSVPGLYKSAFSDLKRKAPTINFDVSWSQNEKNYQYAVNLNVPNESDSARRDMWRYRSEKLTVNNETVWGRSGASTRPVSRSTTKSIAVPAKVRRTPHAPKHKSNAVSMRNPLYAPKLNMFLLWLSCSFVFEKRETEGCKSKSQK